MKLKQLNQLANLPLITRAALQFYETNPNNLRFNLYTWVKKGNLIKLRRDLYLLNSNWLQAIDKQAYLEYIANQLYQPSYISAEYVLNQYNLLTEAPFSITNVTTRKTAKFANKLGRFTYYSIKPQLFTGFVVKKTSFGPVFIATKSKALFDYLYFRFIRTQSINLTTLSQLRLNWENITKTEFKKLKNYAKLSASRRMNGLINLIEKEFYA